MPFLTLLSTLSPIAITITLVVLGELSRRLGAVVKIGPLYRWYYLGALLTFASALVRLLSIGLSDHEFEDLGGNSPVALAYTIPLAMGIVVGVVVAWRYWGWLVYASDGQTPIPNRKQKT